MAHRLSTIREADTIVAMDLARIVDQGTQDQLLAGGGLHADLYATQYEQAHSTRGLRADGRRAAVVATPSGFAEPIVLAVRHPKPRWQRRLRHRPAGSNP